MNYLIDGHNLIAKIPGLSLSMPDDEPRLVELLVRFSQPGKGQVEVYFDAAPPGQAGERKYGRVRAHYVPVGNTADQAIRSRLQSLGRASRSWVVVTSDRAIQAAAREAHARVMPSEEFAELLRSSLEGQANLRELSPDRPLSEEEVKEWLEIFKGKGKLHR